MNEKEFRKRFRRAIGDAPQTDLGYRLDKMLAAPAQRWPVSGMGSIAATVLILIVGGFAGWRLVSQRIVSPATVKPTPAARSTAGVVDPSRCRLPVVVMRGSGPPVQLTTEPGFVDSQSGQYVKGESASTAGLPGGAFAGSDVKPARAAAPVWYDKAVSRWLPVGPQQVAPDGRSYVWVQLLPEGSNLSNFKASELHRYDLTMTTDHTLWSYAGTITPTRWDASGILVEIGPPPPVGTTQGFRLIDPHTGEGTQQPAPSRPSGPTMLPSDQQQGLLWGSFGTDADGHTLYRIGGRRVGDQEWVFYESAPGQRVTIYKGIQGDSTGFDPAQALGDQTGIWFSDYQMHGIWHWDIGTGLKKITVRGLPMLLQGPNSVLDITPAGPCM